MALKIHQPFSLSDYQILLVLGGAALLVYLLKSAKKQSVKPPYPPGPKGYPIIGSLFDMPIRHPWLIYDKWFKQYGDMVFFKVLGQPFLILGSLSRTAELFETRSSIYSSRPQSTMVGELMSFGFVFAMEAYGPWWRRQRRVFHDNFHPNVVLKYRDAQLKGVRSFLVRLLETPDDLVGNIRHAFATTIADVVYGKELQKNDDPYVKLLGISTHAVIEAAVPGTFLVDFFPILKYVPSWFPGASFKRRAFEWSKINLQLLEEPWNEVKCNMKNGSSAKDSVAKDLLSTLIDQEDVSLHDEEQVAKQTCATAALGGSDTTISSVHTFFLAMASNPDIQKRAQGEIDAMVGNTRLPDFHDRPSLPYVNAIIKETLRWQNVTPLSLAHLSIQEDVYDGYFIPKNTVVMGSVWSILHDPAVYSDPLKFVPERFLKNGQLDLTIRDPKVAAFGFGRRICPGRFYSDQSLYAFVSAVLAVYDITPKKGHDGQDIPIKAEMTSGLLSYPVPFDCIIKPRSKLAESLICDWQD